MVRGNADTITFREKPRRSCCPRRLLTTERSGTIKTQRSYSYGRTSFNDDEWAGFEEAAGNSTRVVTVKHADDFRLYRRDGDLPVFNSCRHSDGLPVTLKFADAVGEILVSGPQKQQDPSLPFRHYIYI